MKILGQELRVRSLPGLGYHHVIAFISLVPIVGYAILLAGCSSSQAQMPNIYIIEQSYAATYVQDPSARNSTFNELLGNLTHGSSMIARVGFFGTCIRLPTAIQGQVSWDCGSTTDLLMRYDNADIDPLRLLAAVDVFSRKVLFYGLILAALVLGFAAVLVCFSFPDWHTIVDEDGEEEEVRPFPSKLSVTLLLGLLSFALLFGVTSALWTHVAAVAFSEASSQLFQGHVTTSIGATAIALVWLAPALHGIALLAISNLISSIQLLLKLTEED